MSATIDYYFSMVSPWAFIGHDTLHEIADRHGAAINYFPMALLEVFDRTDTKRMPERHQTRLDLRMLELQRWRAERGLEFMLQPPHWPFNFAPADKMVIAMVGAGHNPAPFMGAVFRATWTDGDDVSGEPRLIEIANECGLDGESLGEVAASEETQGRYEENTEAAVSSGVFGSPSYLLNGELFWGQDRLFMLDDAIASGRAPYSSNPAE